MSASPPSQTPAPDAAAVRHLLRRLARSGGAPWLHQEVARRMAERLAIFRQRPERWLDWWGGLGGGGEAVTMLLPQAIREVAEPTTEWLHISRRGPAASTPTERGGAGRWWPLRRQAPRLVPSFAPASSVALVADRHAAPVGMVWANMMLHLSPAPDATIAQWQAALQTDGFLMFSTLGPDTLTELREVYAAAGWPAPHVPFVDMHDIGDQLVRSGFADPVMDQERITLTWSSPQALLVELRGLGANLGQARPSGLHTPRWRERLQRALAKHADGQGRLAMSFEVIYGHAFKAAPRPARGDPVSVSVDDLKASLPSQRRGRVA